MQIPYPKLPGLVIVLTMILISASMTQVIGQEAGEDSVATVEEGFSGEMNSDIDYEALVKELYGKEKEAAAKVTTPVVSEPIETKGKRRIQGPPPGLFTKSMLNGSHLAFNASSPFVVNQLLNSWYSYIDMGVIIKLPYEIYVESIPLYLLFEISSFSFENSYPEGGTFAGLSYIMQASAIGENSGAAIGFGAWDGAMGSMLELNYRLRPTANTFFRLGTRGVLITNIEPMGAAWWVELRLSMGLEL